MRPHSTDEACEKAAGGRRRPRTIAPMNRRIYDILFLIAFVLAVALFIAGKPIAGLAAVAIAITLVIATALRMRREGRLPGRE